MGAPAETDPKTFSRGNYVFNSASVQQSLAECQNSLLHIHLKSNTLLCFQLILDRD